MLALKPEYSGRRPIRPGVQKLILLILADIDGAGVTIDELAMAAGVHAHTACSVLDVLQTLRLIERRELGPGERCLTPRRPCGPHYSYRILWETIDRMPTVRLEDAAAYRRRIRP